MRPALALAAVLLLAAGCSREPPPTPPGNDDVANEVAPVEPAPPAPAVAAPREAPPVVTNDAADAPDDSAQTQDDADATGMTTRAPPPIDGGDAPVAGNRAADGE